VADRKNLAQLFGDDGGGGGGASGGLAGLFGDTDSGDEVVIPGKRKKKGGGGLGGFLHKASVYSGAELVKHGVSDVTGSLLDLGPGIVELGKEYALDQKDIFEGKKPHRSLDLIKSLAHQYSDYYGHDFFHHFYSHPMQPIIDALTVADVGLGAAAKGGEIAKVPQLAKLRQVQEITTRSPREVVQPGTGGATITDVTVPKPIRNIREGIKQKITRATPATPSTKLGLIQTELTRFGAAIRNDTERSAYMKMPAFDQYRHVAKKLSGDEMTAMHIRALDIHPEDLAQYWRGTPNEAELTPKVTHLAEHPSKKMIRAEPVFRAFARSGAEELKAGGKLSLESEYSRPGRFKVQASEALGRQVRPITGDPYYFPHTTEPVRGSHPFQSVGGGKAPPRAPGTTRQNRGILFSLGKVGLRKDVLGPEYLRRVKWNKFQEIHNALREAAPRFTYDEIMGMEGGKIPKGWEYVRPDASHRVPFSIRGEGEGRLGGEAHHAEIPTSQDLVRLIEDPENLQRSELVKRGMTTGDIEQARHADGKYYIVPTRTARAATGEFTRMGSFAYWFNRYPVKIWRALLLGTRPGFLVNNMIGNSLMYAVRTGGTGALRDFVLSVAEHHGWKTAKELIDDPVTPPALRKQLTAEADQALSGGGDFLPVPYEPPGAQLSRAAGRGLEHGPDLGFSERDVTPGPQPVAPPPDLSFYQRHYPEQMEHFGSFGYTQTPEGFGGRIGHGFGKVTGAIPHLTAYAAEGNIRRALIRNYVRRSPEFRAVYRSLPKETRSFENAAEQLHSGEGGLAFQRRISREVDRSLGQYRHMNGVEQNLLRTVMPFYAWYRAILSTTFHLATDNPIRAAALYQLGQMGQRNMSAVYSMLPSFLQGAIPLGGGRGGTKRYLSTTGLNPWATIEQLVRGSTDDITALGINPFFQGALDEYKRETAHGGHASPAGILGHGVWNIGAKLPTTQLIWPSPPSKLYPERDRESAFLAWLGVPIKEVNPREARKEAKEGR